MKFTAKQIAQMLEGRVEGNENVIVSKLCKIEEGEKEGLSFLANPKYNHYLYSTKSDIVIVNEDFVPEQEVKTTLIRVKDAYSCFARLLEIYNAYRLNKSGVSSLAFIDPEAKVSQDVYVGEFAYIGKGSSVGCNSKIYPQVYIGDNVKIGNNVTLFAGVKVYHDTVIGDNCIVHSGAVLGADGFGFAPLADGSFKKIAQIGNVVIEDDVEIGANATLDRATMGSTKVGKGTKIDNLCQLGHNVVVGNSTVMAAQGGVAGSTKIGDNCFIGGQAGFAGHISVGNRCSIGAQSGIISDVKDGSKLLGAPAIDAKSYMKSYVFFRKLEQMQNRISDLEKRIKELSDCQKQD